jgi:2-dehydro-3-deoxyphosphogluconate aldolase/(4S)-4-hydroxy-2-oxoglutarate aldolase
MVTHMKHVIDAIRQYKLISIVRGLEKDELLKAAEALFEGGVRLLEVTFDQSGKIPDSVTAENIRLLRKTFEGRLFIGAGTVMNESQVLAAKEAGAEYIISPDVNEAVIKKTKELGLVSIPGALTPTEIVTAHTYGADFVKLFPAGDLGISYIKSVRAPLSHIPMLAVGGVTVNNIRDFLDAGLLGVGIGSAIVNKSLIKNGDFEGLTELAREFTRQI